MNGEGEAVLHFGPKLYIQEAQIRAILQKALEQILIWFAFDLCVLLKRPQRLIQIPRLFT